MGFKLGSEKRGFRPPKAFKSAVLEQSMSMLDSSFGNKRERFSRTATANAAMNNERFINRMNMPEGTLAEANMDGTINIDEKIPPSSALFKRAIKHEKEHLDQIESGRGGYGDNYVMWEGKLYIRSNGYIDGPNGKFPEGDENHPWEQEAINAENKQ